MDGTETKTTETTWAGPVAAPPAGSAVTGHLDGVDDEGRVLFRAEGSEVTTAVSIGLVIADEELVQAAWTGRRALVVRTDDPNERAVLVALVRERVSADARSQAGAGLTARVDGTRVRIRADREIELRCGKSRLVMRHDGRVEIHGTNVLTRSRGPNRMKGATIELN